jgi:hypothetical protein
MRVLTEAGSNVSQGVYAVNEPKLDRNKKSPGREIGTLKYVVFDFDRKYQNSGTFKVIN